MTENVDEIVLHFFHRIPFASEFRHGTQSLVKFTPVGKFTNIFRAAFLLLFLFLCKQIMLPNFEYKNVYVYLSYEKTAHKMLVKLTLDKLDEYRIVS